MLSFSNIIMLKVILGCHFAFSNLKNFNWNDLNLLELGHQTRHDSSISTRGWVVGY